MSIVKLKPKIEFAANVIKRLGITDLEPSELVEAAVDVDIDYKDYAKLAKIIRYIHFKAIGYTKIDAFRKAFPDKIVDVKLSTIRTKIERLEQTKLYLKVMAVLHANLYVQFAVERTLVLQQALNIALNENEDIRHRDRYMKLFLEETRKPKDVGVDINIDLSSGGSKLSEIEHQLENISSKLSGMEGKDIIKVLDGSSKKEI